MNQLVHETSPRILAVIRRYARDDDDAQDLLQDCWIQVMEQLDNFKRNGSFAAWATEIGKNVGRMARRRRERTGEQHVAPQRADEVPDRRPNPEEQSILSELRDLLSSAVATLPDRERDMIVLRLIEERSVADAAARIGVSTRSARAIQLRAVTRLRSMYGVMETLEDWEESP